MDITATSFPAVATVSLLCEYMDALVGMGYGTTLTSLLLAVVFLPLGVVSAVLLGQLVGGPVGSLAHQRLGNTITEVCHRASYHHARRLYLGEYIYLK